MSIQLCDTYTSHADFHLQGIFVSLLALEAPELVPFYPNKLNSPEKQLHYNGLMNMHFVTTVGVDQTPLIFK